MLMPRLVGSAPTDTELITRVDQPSFPIRIFRKIVPPARRSVTWIAIGPLIGFLAVFVAVCVLLELRSVVRFTWKPAFLFLLVTPWIWWMHHAGGSGLGGWRAIAALLTRLSL